MCECVKCEGGGLTCVYEGQGLSVSQTMVLSSTHLHILVSS